MKQRPIGPDARAKWMQAAGRVVREWATRGGVTIFYACSAGHDEVRWAWVGGHHCWHCGAVGRKATAYTTTTPEAFVHWWNEDDDGLPPAA